MKDKSTAGFLALFLGWLGIHRFYLNQTGLGILYIILGAVTCFLLPLIIGIVDAIAFFTMGGFEFNQRYNSENKQIHVHVHSNAEEKVKMKSQTPIPKKEKPKQKAAPTPKPRTQKTIKNIPNNPHKTTGVAKFKQYDFKGAKESFKKALAIHYDDVATHFNLACCYSMEEDIDKSLFHLSKSVELGFKDFKRIHKHDALAYLRAHDEFIEFSKNDYQWKTEEEKPKELPAPETDILKPEEEEIDELDLNTPTREKIILIEEVSPQESEMTLNNTDNLFDDFFGDEEDETQIPPTPIQPKEGLLSDDVLEKLNQLGNLRDKGILTEEEFAEQKKRLLG